ncbi:MULTISPECIES: hypothetical protein [unclassified Streptomyces]
MTASAPQPHQIEQGTAGYHSEADIADEGADYPSTQVNALTDRK